MDFFYVFKQTFVVF